MDTIDIRIDLGSVSLLAAGQTLQGHATVTMAVDRSALLALIQGAPASAPAPAPVIPVAIDAIQVPEPMLPAADAGRLDVSTEPPAKKERGRRSPLAKFSDQEIQDAIADSVVKGAERLGSTPAALYRQLKLRGIETARSAEPKPPKSPKVVAAPRPTKRNLAHITDEDLRDAIRSRGLAAAAAHYGVSTATISNEVKRLGIQLKRGRPSSNWAYSASYSGPFSSYGADYVRSNLTALTVARAAELFQCTEKQVEEQKLRLSIGVPRAPAKKIAIVDRPSLTDVSDNDLREILQGGRSWSEVAAD
jgi:hypothetical protein